MLYINLRKKRLFYRLHTLDIGIALGLTNENFWQSLKISHIRRVFVNVHCGPCVDFYRSEPNELLRINMYIITIQSKLYSWRERDAMARAPDCLANHTCVPGSSPAVSVWGFQRNRIVSPFSRRSRWVKVETSVSTVISRRAPRCALCAPHTQSELRYAPYESQTEGSGPRGFPNNL